MPRASAKLTASDLPRILVLDDETRVGRDLMDMLGPGRFHVYAPPIGGTDVVKQAEALARQFRPHVIILDLRLSNHFTDDRSGLSVLEKKLPAVPVILYSNWLTTEITRDAQARHANVRCVGKMEPPEVLVDAVKDAARRTCAARYGLRLQPGPGCAPAEVLATLFPDKPELPPGMVEDLLHRLFPESKAMAIARVAAAHPASVPASRGHSVVCKVTPDGLAPFVVKFGPAEKIEREVRRYARYVRDRLHDRFYGEMNAVSIFWEAGAASYRFIGSSGARLPTFSGFYEQEGDPDVLLRPLRHFFAHLWRPYYRLPLAPFCDPLYESYDQALRLRTRLKNASLRKRVAASAAGTGLSNPLIWLDQHHGASALPDLQVAVTHGDLHGDNLFVDGDHAWAIDFERTRDGHVLRDFAELEVDILTRLAPVPLDDPQTALDFYRVAVSVVPGVDAVGVPGDGWAATPDGRKALAVQAGLRELSREVTGRWRPEEYLWALLFDAVFLVSLAPPDSPQWLRALLLSATLCQSLE